VVCIYNFSHNTDQREFCFGVVAILTFDTIMADVNAEGVGSAIKQTWIYKL
jgi:hypothetical protein